MHQLLAMLRVDITSALVERADMLLFTLSGMFAPLLILLIWLSFTPTTGSSVFSRIDLIWYFLIVIVVKQITSAWGGQFLAARIKRGSISPYLTQPVPYIFRYLSNNISEKVIKVAITVPVILFLVIVLNVDIPQTSLFNFVVSLVSLVLAAALFFLLDILVGLLAFWYDETTAIGEAFGLLYSLFSGAFIPIIALPSAVRTVGILLPFRYSLSFPVEIILGQLNSVQTGLGILIQLIWVLIAYLLCRRLWFKGLRIYSSTGT